MTTAEILSAIEDESHDGRLLTADNFDDAIIGVADCWQESSHVTVVAYDYDKCVKALMAKGMSEDEADEYMSFNVTDAYVGMYTPVFVHNWRGKGE